MNQTENPANYSGVCPESHPYPSDPEGPGDNSSATNWCCVDPYAEEWNECYPTYDETPCPSGGPCSQYKSPETLCEDWEYWNPDLIDPSIPGKGCPDYVVDDVTDNNNNDTSDGTDESFESESEGGLPGFTLVITLVSIVAAVVASRKKE